MNPSSSLSSRSIFKTTTRYYCNYLQSNHKIYHHHPNSYYLNQNIIHRSITKPTNTSCCTPKRNSPNPPNNHPKNNLFQKQQQSCFSTNIAIVNPRKQKKTENEQTKRNQKKISKHRKLGNASSYKFVDTTRVKVMGGQGGKGCISYESKLGSRYKKRPDGGHGGNGGNIIILADANEQSLNMSTHHYRADNGVNGTSRQMHGRNGKDKFIKVPCGVVVKRILGYDEIWDKTDGVVRKLNFEGDQYDNENYDDEEEYELLMTKNNDIERKDSIIDEQKSTVTQDEFNNVNEEDYTETDLEGKNHIDDQNLPDDYDDVVNTGTRSQSDKMYHWNQDVANPAFLGLNYGLDDELASSSSMMDVVEREKVSIADLDKPGSCIVVATGGRGGIGNSAYAKRQFVPHLISRAAERAKGKEGEDVYLELELKLIADIGLVGFPNAGKSSLLAAMSKAKPEIAPYPFTTLHPLIGCVEYHDGFRALVADVPGLIDGAAEGRGRGHDFLRHLERTKALMYIVDAAGVDGRDPLNDLSILVDEIQSYGDADMMARPALVVANKFDLIPDTKIRDEIILALKTVAEENGIAFNGKVLAISAGVTGEGLGTLSKSIRDLVQLGEQNRFIVNESVGSYGS